MNRPGCLMGIVELSCPWIYWKCHHQTWPPQPWISRNGTEQNVKHHGTLEFTSENGDANACWVCKKWGYVFTAWGNIKIHEFCSLNTESIKNREDFNHMLPFWMGYEHSWYQMLGQGRPSSEALGLESPKNIITLYVCRRHSSQRRKWIASFSTMHSTCFPFRVGMVQLFSLASFWLTT